MRPRKQHLALQRYATERRRSEELLGQYTLEHCVPVRSGQREGPKQKGNGIQKLIGGLKNWAAYITFEHAVISFILLSQKQHSIILVFCF